MDFLSDIGYRMYIGFSVSATLNISFVDDDDDAVLMPSFKLIDYSSKIRSRLGIRFRDLKRATGSC